MPRQASTPSVSTQHSVNVCQEVSLTDLSLPLGLLSDGQPGRPTLQKKAGVTGARPALPLSKYVVLVSTQLAGIETDDGLSVDGLG